MKIRYRERNDWCRPVGLKGRWDEYQVVDGRRVVARFDFLHQARVAYPDATRGTGISGDLWDEMTLRMQRRNKEETVNA